MVQCGKAARCWTGQHWPTLYKHTSSSNRNQIIIPPSRLHSSGIVHMPLCSTAMNRAFCVEMMFLHSVHTVRIVTEDLGLALTQNYILCVGDLRRETSQEKKSFIVLFGVLKTIWVAQINFKFTSCQSHFFKTSGEQSKLKRGKIYCIIISLSLSHFLWLTVWLYCRVDG